MTRATRIPRILTLGDSITAGSLAAPAAGYRSALSAGLVAAGEPVMLVGRADLANGGNGTAGNPAGVMAADAFTDGAPGSFLLANIDDASSTFHPDITMIMDGTNNVSFPQDAPTVLGLWSSELDAVWGFMRRPWKRIVVMQMLRRLDGFDSVIQAINAGLPALIAGKSYAASVTLAPTYNALLNADYADSIHPNNVGADKLGNLLVPIVLPIVQQIQAQTVSAIG